MSSRVFAKRLTSVGNFNNRLLFKNNRLLFSGYFCERDKVVIGGSPSPPPPHKENPELTTPQLQIECSCD